MASISLDKVSFWTPPVPEAAECARALRQGHDHSPPPLLESSVPNEGQYDLWALCRQTLGRPISIPSDVETDVSVTDGSDADLDNDGRSDCTLPSISALAEQAKLLRGTTSTREDPDNAPEDPDPVGRPASPASGQFTRDTDMDVEAALVPSSSLSAVSPTASADNAIRKNEAGRKSSPGSLALDRSGGATSTHRSRPETPRSCASLSQPQEKDVGMETDPPCESEAVSPREVVETPDRKSKSPQRTSRRPANNSGALEPAYHETSSSDDDTSLVAGSHDNSHDDAGSFPPSPGRSEAGQGEAPAGRGVDETDESDSRPPKRRKVSPNPVSTQRNSQPRGASLDPHAVNAISQSACNMPRPPSSRSPSHTHPATTAPGAKFEEWPLPNTTLKRVMLGDGRTTFQLQFDWDLCVDGTPPNCPSTLRTRTVPEAWAAPKSRRPESTSGHSESHPRRFKQGLAPASEVGHGSQSGQPRRSSNKRAAFTPEQNRLITQLTEGPERLSWSEIHRQFSTAFPARSQNTLQVHYCTKLKRSVTRKSDAQQVSVTSTTISADTTRRNEELVSQERVTTDSGSTFISRSPTVPVDPALEIA